MNPGLSLDERRLLHTLALRENAALVAFCAIGIALMILVYAWLQWPSGALDSGRAGLALALAVGFSLVGLVYCATPDSRAYSVMLWWAWISLLGVHVFVWDAFLGPHQQMLAQGHLPLVLAGLPLLSLVAHAFLLPRAALRLAGFQVLSALALAAAYLSVNFDLPRPEQATALWAIACMICLPLSAGLLGQLNTSHGEVLNRSLMLATLKQEQANRQARAQLLEDPISGGLNAQGLRTRLNQDIAAGQVSAIAGLCLAGHARRRETMSLTEHKAQIGQMAQLIGHDQESGCFWGRYTETNFIVWWRGISECQLEQKLQAKKAAASIGERLIILTAAVAEEVAQAEDRTLLVLHDMDNRLFLASLD